MNYFLTFLLLAASVLPTHAAIPSEAVVTLPYAEWKSLIEAGKKPADSVPPVPFPLPFAILSAQYRLVSGEASLSGTASFVVRSFRAGTTLVPLLADSLVVSGIEPADASIVVKDGFYHLVIEGQKRQAVILHIEWQGRPDGDSVSFQCAIHPAVVSNLEISPLPEGGHVDVPGAVPAVGSGIWHLGPLEKLEVRTTRRSAVVAGTVVAMPAVVHDAHSTMRIVSDGTFFNATTWKIRHNTAVTWKLVLGRDAQVVSCLVAGRPFAPVRVDDTIEIRLPGTDSDTTVELAYTGKSSPFEPVRGDFSVALPATDLLVESSEWILTLPSAYVPLAVEGNCEFSPGNSKNELRLSKELSRGEHPAARIFYQKPETTKMP